MGALTRHVRFRQAPRDQAIASLDSLMRRVEELSRATGQSLDAAAAVVVEDLERAAAAMTARTAPLVPGSGVLIAAAGILLKTESPSDALTQFFLGCAILFAVLGFSFLLRALIVYAGRRQIGLAPTVDDVAFAHDRLVRKQANTHRGGWLAGIGLACLMLGLLLGSHISVTIG